MKKWCGNKKITVSEVAEVPTLWGEFYSLYRDRKGRYYMQNTDCRTNVFPCIKGSDKKEALHELEDFVEQAEKYLEHVGC